MSPIKSAVFSLVLVAAGCASLPPREADIDAVLTASGTDAQFTWLAQPLPPDRLKGALSLVPDDWIAAINGVVAEQLKPAELRQELREALRKDLSARELGEVYRFYDSASGRAAVAVESASTEPDGNVPAGGDAGTREALANATGLGKAASRLAEKGLSDSFDVALRTNCFGQGSTPFAGLVGGVVKKAQLNAVRKLVNDQVQQRYARLSATDQAHYLAFAQSSAGMKFFQARATVLAGAADRAGTVLGQELTPRFKAFCGKGG